jgi:hypothetical protein
MESRTFTIIQERISPNIKKLTKEILQENLTAKVQCSVICPEDFELWKEAVAPLSTTVLDDVAKYPKVHASYNMAWQQWSSGHTYNSNSGHALYVGSKTRKPILLMIKSKICNMCSAWPKSKHYVDGFDPPLHYCTKNWTGTSQACLDMTVDLYENKLCTVVSICIDMPVQDQ